MKGDALFESLIVIKKGISKHVITKCNGKVSATAYNGENGGQGSRQFCECPISITSSKGHVYSTAVFWFHVFLAQLTLPQPQHSVKQQDYIRDCLVEWRQVRSHGHNEGRNAGIASIDKSNHHESQVLRFRHSNRGRLLLEVICVGFWIRDAGI